MGDEQKPQQDDKLQEDELDDVTGGTDVDTNVLGSDPNFIAKRDGAPGTDAAPNFK